MGKFFKFWRSYLLETRPYFRFPDDNLSKCQGILTKLGICIDMKEIWFGTAYELSARNTLMAEYCFFFLLFFCLVTLY